MTSELNRDTKKAYTFLCIIAHECIQNGNMGELHEYLDELGGRLFTINSKMDVVGCRFTVPCDSGKIYIYEDRVEGQYGRSSSNETSLCQQCRFNFDPEIQDAIMEYATIIWDQMVQGL